MKRPILVAALSLALAGRCVAQSQGRACFRGEPLPTCRSFWITEASYSALLGTRGDYTGTRFSRWSASLDLGHMWNVSPKLAVGGGASANLVDGVDFALRPRIRYWMSPRTSLDFAPALLVAGIPGPPRLAADVSVMTRDRIGVTLQTFLLQTYSYGENGVVTTRNRLVAYGGVRLGSKLGVAGAAADGVVFLAALVSFLIACGNNSCD